MANLTVKDAILMLPIVVELLQKIADVIKTGEPQDIDEAILRLNQARLRPSEEIIKEADEFKVGGTD